MVARRQLSCCILITTYSQNCLNNFPLGVLFHHHDSGRYELSVPLLGALSGHQIIRLGTFATSPQFLVRSCTYLPSCAIIFIYSTLGIGTCLTRNMRAPYRLIMREIVENIVQHAEWVRYFCQILSGIRNY